MSPVLNGGSENERSLVKLSKLPKVPETEDAGVLTCTPKWGRRLRCAGLVCITLQQPAAQCLRPL